jgi:hypothetical protein
MAQDSQLEISNLDEVSQEVQIKATMMNDEQ